MNSCFLRPCQKKKGQHLHLCMIVCLGGVFLNFCPPYSRAQYAVCTHRVPLEPCVLESPLDQLVGFSVLPTDSSSIIIIIIMLLFQPVAFGPCGGATLWTYTIICRNGF